MPRLISSTRRSATAQQAMWTWMRRRRAPWTVPEMTGAVAVSQRQAFRYVARLAAAKYLAVGQRTEPNNSGGYRVRVYGLARDTGPLAPQLEGGAPGEGVRDANSDMTGRELVRLRKASGLSKTAYARDVLAVDLRTLARYEDLTVVPPSVAERARNSPR